MSGTKRARQYVRDHLKDLGLVEHRGLDWENISETQIDNKFHIESEEVDGLPKTQGTQPVEIDLIVRFWTKPKSGQDPTDALEKNHDTYDSIMQRLQDERNIQSAGLVDVLLDSYLPGATSGTNNQIIKGELSLTIKMDFCYRDPSIV